MVPALSALIYTVEIAVFGGALAASLVAMLRSVR